MVWRLDLSSFCDPWTRPSYCGENDEICANETTYTTWLSLEIDQSLLNESIYGFEQTGSLIDCISDPAQVGAVDHDQTYPAMVRRKVPQGRRDAGWHVSLLVVVLADMRSAAAGNVGFGLGTAASVVRIAGGSILVDGRTEPVHIADYEGLERQNEVCLVLQCLGAGRN